MANHLPGMASGVRQIHPVQDVVQPQFQTLQKVFTGNSLLPKVIIADGAIFEGNIDMKSRDEKTEETPDEDDSSDSKPFSGRQEPGNSPRLSRKR